jgi:hypothetical protein
MHSIVTRFNNQQQTRLLYEYLLILELCDLVVSYTQQRALLLSFSYTAGIVKLSFDGGSTVWTDAVQKADKNDLQYFRNQNHLFLLCFSLVFEVNFRTLSSVTNIFFFLFKRKKLQNSFRQKGEIKKSEQPCWIN